MGRETYCFICGGPLNNHGKIFKDMKFVKKFIDSVKNPKHAKILSSGDIDYGAFPFIENAEYLEVSPENISKLRKSIIDLSKKAKYKWLSKCVILDKSGKNIPVTTFDSWEGTFKDKKGHVYVASFLFDKKISNNHRKMLDPNSSGFYGDGYVMHQDCYNLAKNKYSEFNIENVSLKEIDFGEIKKYQHQDVPWNLFFYNNVEYMLESPLKNIKNKNRILKLKHPIESGKKITIPKEKKRSHSKPRSRRKSRSNKLHNNRPSPSVSATKFSVGTQTVGNDGNMWEITTNKNNVKRWKKV